MADSISPPERIGAAFAKLTTAAKNINDMSNELAKPIVSLETALGRLNLGVACWSKFAGGGAWRHDVGYAQVRGVWCIAIRTLEGPDDNPVNSTGQTWAFNEAPRFLRIKAVDMLPDLVEALVQTAEATTKRIHQKLDPANELAAAVNAQLKQQK